MGRRNRRRATNAQTEDSIVMTVDEILKETEDDTEDVSTASVEDDDAEVDTADVDVDDAEDEKKRIFFKKKKDKETKDAENVASDDDMEDDDDDELDLDDPVNMGEWVLSIFLAAVPIVNIICLLVWAFGQNNKPSKKTWARAKLIWLLVEVVLLALVAAFFIGMLTGGAF